jgi:transcriptional regulator with XRE-family HTH domain
MDNENPFEQIAALRVKRGETLAQFALTLGISSKGRISEMEKGLVRPTVAQALAIEKLSDGRIDAAALNADVAAARRNLPPPTHCIPGSDADSGIHRQVLCDVCQRSDVRDFTTCVFVDCPHSNNVGIAA